MTLLPAPGTRDYRHVFLTEQERWAERRRLYWRNRPRRCAACGITEGIDLHHRHYEKPTGQELDGTLVGLCKPHHRRIHKLHDRIAPRDVRPYRHLGWITTMYIAYTRFRLSAWCWAINLVAAGWFAVTVGLWVPVLAAFATIVAGPIRRKIGR